MLKSARVEGVVAVVVAVAVVAIDHHHYCAASTMASGTRYWFVTSPTARARKNRLGKGEQSQDLTPYRARHVAKMVGGGVRVGRSEARDNDDDNDDDDDDDDDKDKEEDEAKGRTNLFAPRGVRCVSCGIFCFFFCFCSFNSSA